MIFSSKQSFAFSFLLVSLLALAGCGPRYTKKAVVPLSTQSAHFQETKSEVTLRVAQLNSKQADELFDGRGHYLFNEYRNRKAIYPIQLTIQNDSNDALILDVKNINLQLVSNDRVVKRMRYQGNFRAVNIAFFGTVFCIPIVAILFYCAPLGLLMGAGISITTLFAGVAGGFLILTSTTSFVQHSQSKKANEQITQDINQKTFADQLIIEAGQQQEALIFADSRFYKKEFLVSLESQNSKETISFDVQLK
jgi:hypothetical protein